jgi:hypothetical protein
MNYLFQGNQTADATALAIELAPAAADAEVNLFLGVIDRLLQDAMSAEALRVWNALAERGRIARGTLHPGAGNVVTNSGFTDQTYARGFDWRIPRTNSVFVTQAPGAWVISLTGSQPERCDLLRQFVPLEPGRTYRFQARYRARPEGTGGEIRNSGLSWRVRAADGSVLGESGALATEGAGESQFEFAAPQGVRGAWVILEFERSSGSVRMAGSLRLEQVRLAGL